MLTRLQNEKADRSSSEKVEYQIPTPPWLGDPKPWLLPVSPTCDVPMELDPRPTEETRGKESLKIKINLKRLLSTREVPMEVDPGPIIEESRECLKIRIDPRRLKVLGKEQRAPY